ARYEVVDDDEALAAFHGCCRIEGIIPALESSHAIAWATRVAPGMATDKLILVNLSGRGDKDMHTVARRAGIEFWGRADEPAHRRDLRPAARGRPQGADPLHHRRVPVPGRHARRPPPVRCRRRG